MGSYRDLTCWQKAMDLAAQVHTCSPQFPCEEMYGSTFQVRRAAVSVPSNIAEGHGRETPADFRYFLRFSRGSAQEVETQLLLAVRFGYVTGSDIQQALSLCDEVCRLIRRLGASLGQ